MFLRKLNLAPRSAVCFGFFCLIIIAMGVLALRQAGLLKTAEKYVETNVLPSVQLLGQLDREFVTIRGNNARVRNPIEPQERRTKAISDIQQSRQLIDQYSQSLKNFIVTPRGQEAFARLREFQVDYFKTQDNYLSLVSAQQLEGAVAISNGPMKEAADKVETALKNLISINQDKAKKPDKTPMTFISKHC